MTTEPTQPDRTAADASRGHTEVDHSDGTAAPPPGAARGGGGIPLRFGAYRALRELGRGGMGAVLLVEQEGTGRRYALKTLFPHAVEDPRVRERFVREAQGLAELDHPHVVTIFSADVEGGWPYLVQELLTGGSLKDRLRTGPLPLGEVVRLGVLLARALQAVHEAGLLHRDLKPENVMLDGEGQPRLVDFGLVRSEGQAGGSLTRTGQALGTPRYMAPEQLDDAKRVDARADVYGLGATLYALLCGRPPVVAQGVAQAYHELMTRDPDPLRALRPEVPADLEAVVMRCLAKAPEARLPSAGALAEALAGCGAGEAPPRRRGPLLAAAALGAGAVLAGLALALPGEEPGDEPEEPAVAEEAGRAEGPGDAGSAAEEAPDPAAEALGQAPPWFLELAPGERPPLPLPAGLEFGPGPREYTNEADGSILVWIPPGGPFELPTGKRSPPRQAQVSEGFYLGKYEVSMAQFLVFLDTERPPEASRWDLVRDVTPPEVSACNMSWRLARDYCAWSGLRLPTHAEWHWAAFGGERRYPWGHEEWSGDGEFRGNFSGPDGVGGLGPIDIFPLGRTPEGCLNMGGNVKEYLLDQPSGEPVRDDEDRTWVFGGSYGNGADEGYAERTSPSEDYGTRALASGHADQAGIRVALSPR